MQPTTRFTIETAMQEALYVVDSGEQDVTYPLYLIWEQQYKNSAINFGNESLLSRYEDGVKTSLETKMFAEIKLIKIKEQVLGLLYPIGNQSNHEKMLRVVLLASGIGDNSRRVTNFTNSHVVLSAIASEEKVRRKQVCQKVEGLDDEKQSALEKVDFVIQVDGPWMCEFFTQTKLNQLAHTVIGTTTFPYNIVEDLPYFKEISSWASIHGCSFMGLKIAFVHSSGLFSNHEALRKKFEKWFPQNPTVVTVEKLIGILSSKPEAMPPIEKMDTKTEKDLKSKKFESDNPSETKPEVKEVTKNIEMDNSDTVD